MLEALFLALAAIVLVGVVVFVSLRGRMSGGELRLRIASANDRLLIAEKRFMKGKIKKSVFDSIVDSLEEEQLSAELALFRLEKSASLEVPKRSEKVISLLARPTPYRKAKVNSILKETDLIRHEMSLLEARLLKRQLKQTVFEKLIAQKEAKLIEKEKELGDVVASAQDFSTK